MIFLTSSIPNLLLSWRPVFGAAVNLRVFNLPLLFLWLGGRLKSSYWDFVCVQIMEEFSASDVNVLLLSSMLSDAVSRLNVIRVCVVFFERFWQRVQATE